MIRRLPPWLLSAALLFAPALLPGQRTAGPDAFDPLAADSTAARYRTGAVDERASAVPASIQEPVFRDPKTNLPALVRFLTEDTTDQFLKVKRIHDWITDHIAYDSDLLRGLSKDGKREVVQFMPLRRTTCGGFAGLFSVMTKLAGLEAERISGRSKSCWLKGSKRDCGHVWNAVRLHEKWYIVDTTADNRQAYRAGVFGPKRAYSDLSLFIDPAAKILVNLPLQSRHQFLDRPWTQTEFMKMPRVSLLFHHFRLRYPPNSISLFSQPVRDDGPGRVQKIYDLASPAQAVFSLNVVAPEDLLFSARLVRLETPHAETGKPGKSKADLGTRAFCIRQGNVLCSFSAPAPGTYTASLLVRRPQIEARFFAVHTFTLVAPEAGPALPEPSNRLYPNALFRAMHLRLPAPHISWRDGTAIVDVDKPAEVEVGSQLYDADDAPVSRSVVVSYPSRTRLRFFYNAHKTGPHALRIYVLERRGSATILHTVALARVRFEPTIAVSLPPRGEILYSRSFAELGMELVREDVGSGGRAGMFSLTIRSPVPLDCAWTNTQTRRRVASGCTVDRVGEVYSFLFRPPAPASHSATVSLLRGKTHDKRSATLLRFAVETAAGP